MSAQFNSAGKMPTPQDWIIYLLEVPKRTAEAQRTQRGEKWRGFLRQFWDIFLFGSPLKGRLETASTRGKTHRPGLEDV